MPRVDLLQFGSDRELAAVAAREWVQFVVRTASERGRCSVALSGGRIAKAFYQEIIAQAPAAGVRGDVLEMFWADERCVPPDHPESNYAVAKPMLLDPLGVPDSQVHRIRGELSPADGAIAAEEEIRRVLKTPEPAFAALDLVILGMGEDGHVASLFPGDHAENIQTAPHFRSVVASKPPPNRITLTYRALQSAREVWVLASGQGKFDALSRSLLSVSTPCGQVRATRSQLRIFSDIQPM